MIGFYLVYIAIMVFNDNIKEMVVDLSRRIKGPNESTPLTTSKLDIPEAIEDEAGEHNSAELAYPWQRPSGASLFGTVWWALFIPTNLLFFLTIPDVRCATDRTSGGITNMPCFKYLYLVSFAMCAGMGISLYYTS